jgi:hypothetical protein
LAPIEKKRLFAWKTGLKCLDLGQSLTSGR